MSTKFMNKDLIAELEWRGMLQDIMPGTREQLNKEMTTAYIGFDPTADSLHIGSLVPILLLMHLQKAGHRPVALVGGATGMVGDPSMKSEERNLLDEATLQKNVEGIKRQLMQFLDFDTQKANAALMVNNYDWFKDISFIAFLRDVGKHITVNYMMAKDSVRKRIEGDTGISYTEFAYQLMQGYDFYWLYKNLGVKLQMGGSDQWGNITTGTELVRRMTNGAGEAFAFTCKLITKADGGKFGKTEKGNVWLDPNRTSPYQFYQFWLNAADDDASKWIRIFTFLEKDTIESLESEHLLAPHNRILQKKLAEEVTTLVHGKDAFEFAVKASEILFGNATAETLLMLNEDQLLQVLDGIPTHPLGLSKLEAGYDIVSALADAGIFPSKGEARKMVQGGGVQINKQKVSGIDYNIHSEQLMHGKYLLVQRGKKNYHLIIAE
ncbi:MAG: tyrosine--tRNA ligase [Chitinophagaceae bacterium]|nr:tyrosine--tRNA ligase [Chitinophagaceae bacterium]